MKGKYKDKLIEIRQALNFKDFWVSPEVGFVKKSEVELVEEVEQPAISTESTSNILIKVAEPKVTAEIDIEKS